MATGTAAASGSRLPYSHQRKPSFMPLGPSAATESTISAMTGLFMATLQPCGTLYPGSTTVETILMVATLTQALLPLSCCDGEGFHRGAVLAPCHPHTGASLSENVTIRWAHCVCTVTTGEFMNRCLNNGYCTICIPGCGCGWNPSLHHVQL